MDRPEIRITSTLLEHALDLPEGCVIVKLGGTTVVDGVPCISFGLSVLPGTPAAEVFSEDRLYALQYEETEVGTSLVSAIPVPG